MSTITDHLRSSSVMNKSHGFEVQAHNHLLSACFLEISDLSAYVKQPDSMVLVYK